VGALIRRLLDVLRLRSGPQDLPPGWTLAATLSMAYIAQGFLTGQALEESDIAARSLLAISVQFLAIALLLRFKNLSARLPQTITTLAGTGLIFGFLSIFLVRQADPESEQPLLALVWFSVFLWSIAVDGHIYRHALSITMSMGVLVAVMIFTVNLFLLELMF
jgi:hypothetical protein